MYYHWFAGKSKTLRGWHDYIGTLERAITDGYKPAAEAQTLVYLSQLRDSIRNPIMHPRVVLEEADSFMIFDLSCGVIGRMAQELQASSKPTRKRKPRIKAVRCPATYSWVRHRLVLDEGEQGGEHDGHDGTGRWPGGARRSRWRRRASA